jgi:hypothetical protein
MNTQMQRSPDKFLLVVLAGSLTVNVFLALSVSKPLQARSIVSLGAPGDLSPGFSAVRVRGGPELVSYPFNKPTLVYVMTPNCKWCKRNGDNIRSLYDRRKKEYRFVGITLSSEGIGQYVDDEKVPFPVYQNVPPNVLRALGLGNTPQTILVGTDGRIQKNWVGAYMGNIQSEVEQTFAVKLPGTQLH